MSFKIGGSASKTTTSSSSSSNSATAPLAPEWAQAPVQAAASRVNSLFGLAPESLVAPAHGLQTQAASGAGGLTSQPWNYDHAAELMRGVARSGANTYAPTAAVPAASVLDGLQAYMSPYRDQVVNAALGDFDFQAGRTRAQQALDLARSGAFGGSGAALTQSMTEDALARGRASTSADLLDQMFQRATALADADANRRQQVSLANAGAANEAGRYNAGAGESLLQRQMEAANGLARISDVFGASQRADIATQLAAGEAMRGIGQQQREAPITSTQQIVAMLNGLPISLFTGQQTQSNVSSTGSEKRTGFTAEGGSK